MGSTGFTVVDHFCESFRTVCRADLPRLSTKGKMVFNQRVAFLKESYGFDSHDVLALIDFMYLHNPLGYDNLAAYGQVNTMYKAAPVFAKWKRQHEGSLGRIGLRELIYRLRPKASDGVGHEVLAQLRAAIQEDA